MKRIELPERLRAVFFDLRWETAKLWALPTPVSHLRVEDLAWHLALPVWSTVPGEGRFDLSPITVMEAPNLHPRHWAKIHAADVSYPLEMFRRGERWVIVDGYHRLCRHQLEHRAEVPVRLHPDECWRNVAPDAEHGAPPTHRQADEVR